MIFHGKLTFFLKRKLHLFDGKTHKNIIFTDESFRMTDVFCKKCFEIKKNLSCTIFSTSREEKNRKIILFVREKTKQLRRSFVLMCETDGKEKKKVISQDFFTFHSRTFFSNSFFFMCETVEIFPKAILFLVLFFLS